MSRVEASESIGLEPYKSIDNASIPTFGKIFSSSNYTKHSYQVSASSLSAASEINFLIFATNDEKRNWHIIANYVITNSNHNRNGILHFDTWNFAYTMCSVNGVFGGAKISVVEKHNA